MISEPAIFVAIRDGARTVAQRTHAATAVVPIEARCPGAGDRLLLADPLQALAVLARHCATAVQLFHDLRITSRIQIVHQVVT